MSLTSCLQILTSLIFLTFGLSDTPTLKTKFREGVYSCSFTFNYQICSWSSHSAFITASIYKMYKWCRCSWSVWRRTEWVSHPAQVFFSYWQQTHHKGGDRLLFTDRNQHCTVFLNCAHFVLHIQYDHVYYVYMTHLAHVCTPLFLPKMSLACYQPTSIYPWL